MMQEREKAENCLKTRGSNLTPPASKVKINISNPTLRPIFMKFTVLTYYYNKLKVTKFHLNR